MIRFLLFNDVHLSHHGPVSRTDNWAEAIFAKLEQVLQLAVKLRVSGVCIGGDLFHHKSRFNAGLIRRLLDWAYVLKANGIQIFVIPGNHDLVHDRLESLPTQPLGVLFASRLFEDVSFRAVVCDGVVVSGIPYPLATQAAAYAEVPRPDRLAPGTPGILMVHAFVSAAGGEYWGEPVIPFSTILPLGYSIYLIGHDHSYQGVMKTESGQYVVHIGALSRGSIALEDVTREPRIVIAEFDGDPLMVTRVREVRLQVRPSAEVFDLALKAAKDAEAQRIETFVADLSAQLSGVATADLPAAITALDVPDEVRARVRQYVETAEAQQTR